MEKEGFADFFGTPCVFHYEKEGIRLFPQKPNDYSLKQKALMKKNFIFSFSDNLDEKCIAYIEDTQWSIGISVILRPRYVIHLLKDTPINGFELKGTVLDEFFSASSFFYVKKASGSKSTHDYIYGNETVDQWEINFEGDKVEVLLSYGEILRHGIASDLMLHSKLTVKFPATVDVEYIYRLYSIITLFLKIVRYKQDPINCKVRLFGEGDSNNIGRLYDWHAQEENVRETNHCDYIMFKACVNNLLQFCADNPNLVVRHFPVSSHRFFRKDYSPNDMTALFAAFESECKADSEVFEKTDETALREIRKKVVEAIEILKKVTRTTVEDEFIDTAISNIKRQGTELGQRKKLINAFQVMRPVIDISSKRLLNQACLGDDNGFSDADFDKIAKYINKLRGKTTHENSIRNFSEEDIEYIQFFEIVVYAQLLRRAGVDTKTIQYVLGSQFFCNDTLMEYLDYRSKMSLD